MSNIEILQNLGYEVHVAANFINGNSCTKERIEEFKNNLNELGILYYQIDFNRNIFNVIDNLRAYIQVKELLFENSYDFIHCHSPIGGVCGRIAAHKTKTHVIYTVHGFHFFKGGSVLSWVLYYPIERFLARYTDVIITITKEDFKRALSFKTKKVEYIPGVGIDTHKYSKSGVDSTAKRSELGVPRDAYLLLSIGELNRNKNHEIIIKAIKTLKNQNAYYLICGIGRLEAFLKNLAKSLGIAKQVIFLGFRNDLIDILEVSDVFLLPSYREGLSMALMEAMSIGCPVICSEIRGNRDLIESDKGGYLIKPDDADGFATAIDKTIKDNQRIQMGVFNTKKISGFDIGIVGEKMIKIYSDTKLW